MGDADILIRTAQYDRIRPVVASLGLTEQYDADYDYTWISEKLKLELHKRLVSTSNSDFYAYFGDGWRLARKGDGFRYTMTAEDAYIYQFVHYAKHYRDGGIGCRHMVDLWVYRRAYPDMDMGYIRAELEKLGLLDFYRNTCRLLAFWFEGGEGDERTEFMSDFIFDSGSWGKWKNHILAAEVRQAKYAGSVWGGKIRALLRAFFPARKNLINLYPVLKRAPWLLPVIWPARWVDVLLFRRQNITRKQKERRIATGDNVDEFQKALDYVGLDFRFGA